MNQADSREKAKRYADEIFKRRKSLSNSPVLSPQAQRLKAKEWAENNLKGPSHWGLSPPGTLSSLFPSDKKTGASFLSPLARQQGALPETSVNSTGAGATSMAPCMRCPDLSSPSQPEAFNETQNLSATKPHTERKVELKWLRKEAHKPVSDTTFSAAAEKKKCTKAADQDFSKRYSESKSITNSSIKASFWQNQVDFSKRYRESKSITNSSIKASFLQNQKSRADCYDGQKFQAICRDSEADWNGCPGSQLSFSQGQTYTVRQAWFSSNGNCFFLVAEYKSLWIPMSATNVKGKSLQKNSGWKAGTLFFALFVLTSFSTIIMCLLSSTCSNLIARTNQYFSKCYMSSDDFPALQPSDSCRKPLLCPLNGKCRSGKLIDCRFPFNLMEEKCVLPEQKAVAYASMALKLRTDTIDHICQNIWSINKPPAPSIKYDAATDLCPAYSTQEEIEQCIKKVFIEEMYERNQDLISLRTSYARSLPQALSCSFQLFLRENIQVISALVFLLGGLIYLYVWFLKLRVAEKMAKCNKNEIVTASVPQANANIITIHQAVEENLKDLINVQLSHNGFDVNSKNFNGETILQMASCKLQAESVLPSISPSTPPQPPSPQKVVSPTKLSKLSVFFKNISLEDEEEFFIQDFRMASVSDFEHLDQEDWDSVKNKIGKVPTRRLRKSLQGEEKIFLQGNI